MTREKDLILSGILYLSQVDVLVLGHKILGFRSLFFTKNYMLIKLLNEQN